MTCPGCQAPNRAERRYCGRCGCNFAPACQACGFANEVTDRYCGGCGDSLQAGTQLVLASPSGAATTEGAWSVDELAGLFAQTPAAVDENQLPETGVDQEDLDRLFGAVQ
jgi:hypothetical protein